MLGLVLLFALVLLFNLMPAFAPPTWLALCVIGTSYPELNPFLLALTTAAAATLGRIGLAWMAEHVVRRRFLRQGIKDNIDVLRETLARHEHATLGALLLYGACPLPSTCLFIAWGLTSLPLRLLALPYFVGRCIIYTIWIFVAHASMQWAAQQPLDAWFGSYFILAQVLLLASLYAFARIDWRALLAERKLRLIPRRKDQ